MMKTCFACHETKPLSEFYVHPQMGDGHLNKCKDCVRTYMKARCRAGLTRAIDHRRHQKPARRAYQQAMTKKLKRLYPERAKARWTTSNAIRDGRLVRQPCEVCGARGDAHHEDYARPLDVRWLCKVHHEALHHGIVA